MSEIKKSTNGASSAVAIETPRSVQIASGGLNTTADIATFGSALATDIMTGSVTPKTGAAAVGALRMTLRAFEFQLRYGEGGTLRVADCGSREPTDRRYYPLKVEEAQLCAQLEQVRQALANR